MKDLEEVIRQAEASAQKRGGSAKPIKARPRIATETPSPGEPELAAPKTGIVPANNFERKRKSRMATDMRYRKFANEYFRSGFNGAKALEAAGYKYKRSNIAISNAIATLMKQEVVQHELARLSDMFRAMEDSKTIDCTKLWIEIAKANVFDFLETADDGTLKLRDDAKEMSAEQQRAIRKIRITKSTRHFKDGEREVTVNTEIELWDRLAALNAIAQVQKLFKDSNDSGMEGLANMLAERLNSYQQRGGRIFDAEFEDAVSG